MLPVDLAAFQRLHVGPDGQKLLPDGVLGPKTAWALALEALPLWRQNVVLGALKWVGQVHETSENSSPEIDAWLGSCGVQPGNRWCAAFVSACLRAAGINCAEASVELLAGKYPETLVPLPGDIACRLTPDHHHCGLVTGTEWLRFSACEGNSNDGVRAGTRERADWRFFTPMGQPIPGVWTGLPELGAKTV